MNRTSTLQRRTPMNRKREDRPEGLGRKVEVIMGFYRPPGHKMPTRLRSERHRRNVATLDCVICGRAGPSQCAHANFGKSLASKADDTMTFAACPDCHRHHDTGGIPKAERRRLEVVYVDRTRAELISRSLWTPDIERAYRAAYEPMKRAAE